MENLYLLSHLGQPRQCRKDQLVDRHCALAAAQHEECRLGRVQAEAVTCGPSIHRQRFLANRVAQRGDSLWMGEVASSLLPLHCDLNRPASHEPVDFAWERVLLQHHHRHASPRGTDRGQERGIAPQRDKHVRLPLGEQAPCRDQANGRDRRGAQQPGERARTRHRGQLNQLPTGSAQEVLLYGSARAEEQDFGLVVKLPKCAGHCHAGGQVPSGAASGESDGEALGVFQRRGHGAVRSLSAEA